MFNYVYLMATMVDLVAIAVRAAVHVGLRWSRCPQNQPDHVSYLSRLLCRKDRAGPQLYLPARCLW